MTTADAILLERLFAAAIDAPAAARDAAVRAIAGGRTDLADEAVALARLADRTQELPTLVRLDGAEAVLLPGDEIGGWDVLGYLGRGSFGKVYRVRHRVLGHEGALKLLGHDTASDARREARTLALLDHPDVARVLELDRSASGPTAGQWYHVTAFIDGIPLDRWGDRHRPSLDRVARIVARIARATAYLHGRQVVHRDLKPSNVLVRDGDAPVVIDVGVATMLAPVDHEHRDDDPIVGSLRYLPPELLRGSAWGTQPGVDVFALGTILHELATGRPPHPIPPAPATVADYLEVKALGAPPLDLDPEHRGILERALAPEPADRPDATTLADWLERAADRRPLPWTGRSRRARMLARRRPDVVALAALLALTTIAGITATAINARDAATSRAAANARDRAYRQFAQYVIFDVNDMLADTPGTVAVRQEIVQEAAARLLDLAQPPVDDDLALELAEGLVKLANTMRNRRFAAGAPPEAIASLPAAVFELLGPRLDRLPARARTLVAEMHVLSSIQPGSEDEQRRHGRLAIEVTESVVDRPPRMVLTRTLARSYLSRRSSVDEPEGRRTRSRLLDQAEAELLAAMAAAPDDPMLVEADAWLQYWRAYDDFDRRRSRAADRFDRAAAIFRALAESGSRRFLASAESAACMGRLSRIRDGEIEAIADTIVAAEDGFARIDRLHHEDPDDYRLRRMGEVMRAMLAEGLADRVEADEDARRALGPSGIRIGITWANEALRRFPERAALGFTRGDARYPDGYRRWIERLERVADELEQTADPTTDSDATSTTAPGDRDISDTAPNRR